METRIKVIDITPVVTTDIYFEDASKWTFTKSGPSSYNTSTFTNNDLTLVVGRKGTLPGNIAKAVNNGVVLDPTKEYLMFIKVNNNSNYQSNFTICGINFNNIPQGKEIIRRFKPTTTSIEFKLAQKVTNTTIQAGIMKDKVIIDYCRIVEYDLKYLDVMKTEDILYQSNVKDIYEPDKIKSDYTKSFELPGSYVNNKFFSHWYKVSANGDFDHNVKMPVIIQKGEIDIIEGYMYLNDVKLNSSQIVYNITIIAEMANIWDEISTLKVTDLDLTEYNHSINMLKMYVDLPSNGTVASPPSSNPSLVNTIWTYETQKSGIMSYLTMPNGTTRAKITITGHGYQEGDFVRVSTRLIPPLGSPLIIASLTGDYVVEGVFDADTFYINSPAPAITSGGTLNSLVKRKNFTGNGWYYAAINRGHTTKNLMTPTKSKPQLFVKGIWDKIFKEAGYRYTSEFLNTNYFKSLCADLVTKEITQLSEDLKAQNVEARNNYTATNPMLTYTGSGSPDNRKFLKTTYLRDIGNDSCGNMKRVTVKDYQGGISYDTIFSHDLDWGTELVDLQGILSPSGVWTPKLNGDYQFNVQLTVGVSMINSTMQQNYILPQKQTFKKTSHWAGFDNDMDGTPASTNLWVYNSGPRDGNSGMVFWLEIQQVSDSKSIWKSAEYLCTPASRIVSRYNFNEGYIDINQTAALFLKKDVGYKVVLKYTRNQKLFMGAEGNGNNKWRWGTNFVEYGALSCIPSYYTETKSPNSFGATNWSIWMVGNNQTTNIRTSTINGFSNKQITGYNNVKFELIQSVSEGSDVYLKHFITDMTQTEFLSSVNKMFNLHWYWDRNNKQYIIEPFYNFYKQDELDWTKKVDLDSEIMLEPLDNSKKYTLKYKDSGDYYNKDYKDAFGTTYGESNVISANEIATEEKTIESGFSIGVLVQFPVKPLNTMVMPTYSSQNIGNNTSNESNSGDNVFIYICGGWQYTQSPMLLDDGNATQTQVWESIKYDHFPFAGHIDSTYAPYYDICYANPAQFSYIMKNYTTHNLYNKFWRDWFNLMLNKEQKLITYYMNLTDVDIFNLDYSKRYVINGEPLRLVSISDYNLNANNLAKVEFIKDIGSKVFIPKTISNGGGNFPIFEEPDTPWTNTPWTTDNPWNTVWEDYEPGGGIYNPVTSYAANSFLDARSRTTAETTSQQKDKNTGNSAQFDSINMGVNNVDVGGENYVTGNSNRVFGSGNFVSGRNNQVKSQNAIVMGDNIKAVRPGIYFQDVYIDELGIIHNATNVFNGGSNTTNYIESVNNLYKPNVLGLISGTGSPTNPFSGVMEIQNPNLQFSRVIGVDIRHDDIDNIRNY